MIEPQHQVLHVAVHYPQRLIEESDAFRKHFQAFVISQLEVLASHLSVTGVDLRYPAPSVVHARARVEIPQLPSRDGRETRNVQLRVDRVEVPLETLAPEMGSQFPSTGDVPSVDLSKLRIVLENHVDVIVEPNLDINGKHFTAKIDQ